jgi:hypothetical protein
MKMDYSSRLESHKQYFPSYKNSTIFESLSFLSHQGKTFFTISFQTTQRVFNKLLQRAVICEY